MDWREAWSTGERLGAQEGGVRERRGVCCAHPYIIGQVDYRVSQHLIRTRGDPRIKC